MVTTLDPCNVQEFVAQKVDVKYLIEDCKFYFNVVYLIIYIDT